MSGLDPNVFPLPDNQFETPPSQPETPATPYLDAWTNLLEEYKQNNAFLEWRPDGEVVSHYLDIRQERVDFTLSSQANCDNYLSVEQLEHLVRLGAKIRYDLYQNVLTPAHFDLIDRYEATYYPPQPAVEPIVEIATEPAVTPQSITAEPRLEELMVEHAFARPTDSRSGTFSKERCRDWVAARFNALSQWYRGLELRTRVTMGVGALSLLSGGIYIGAQQSSEKAPTPPVALWQADEHTLSNFLVETAPTVATTSRLETTPTTSTVATPEVVESEIVAPESDELAVAVAEPVNYDAVPIELVDELEAHEGIVIIPRTSEEEITDFDLLTGQADYYVAPTVNPELVLMQLQIIEPVVEVSLPAPRVEQPAAARISALDGPTVDGQFTQEQIDWMNAAGIAQADWSHVDYIITKESGWRPFIWNQQGSSAYGLCQTMLSVHSVAEDFMTNPVTQLRWCDNYAKTRYGGWAGAERAWRSKNWW